MLKMALKKPLILEQENHPIRRLFNEMAKYAIGLEQGDCEDNKFISRWLRCPRTMLDDSFDEQRLPQIFSEFMSLLDRDRRMTAMAEEKEVERVAAQEKINWARTRVEEEIGKRMVGREHPQAGDRLCSAQLVCGAAYGASAQWRIRRRLADGA